MPKMPLSSLTITVGLALVLAAACGRRTPIHQGTASDAATATAVTTTATPLANEGDEAIQQVKRMINAQGGLTARLSLPYPMSSTQFIGCSPQEAEMEQSANPHNPELWRCKSPSGGPPFQKQVTTMTTQCCKTQTATVRSGDISNWRAEDAGDGQQKVSADYAVLGQSHHSTWLVDTKTRKIGPQGDS